MSDTSDQIVENLGPREVIAEAVDILSEKHGITEGAALDMLVRLLGDAYATVRKTAGRIVAAHVGP
jgi:AmiR/NasT family two-component response regulator